MSSASFSSRSGCPCKDEQLDDHVEQFPLVTRTTADDELHGFLFGSLERIGGTPCILWGLGAIRRGRQARAALDGLVGELYRRAAISFPDEDVLVAGPHRASRRRTRCSACSPTCARARSTRRTARSGRGAGGSPAGSAATPATTTARSALKANGASASRARHPSAVKARRQGRRRGRRRGRPAQGRGRHRVRLGDGRGARRRPRVAQAAATVSAQPPRRRVAQARRRAPPRSVLGRRDRQPAGVVLAHVRGGLARRRGRGRRGAA